MENLGARSTRWHGNLPFLRLLGTGPSPQKMGKGSFLMCIIIATIEVLHCFFRQRALVQRGAARVFSNLVKWLWDWACSVHPSQTVFNPFLSPFRWDSSIRFLRIVCHLDNKNPCCKIVQAFKKLITSAILHFCFLFLTFSASRIIESNL